jgi:hypothetical protein|tara:strand:+ start:173 stop:364 length:192 start_codon:yes stop_codon:yes gene_type:complete
MLKTIRQLEIPLYLLIIAMMVYETSLVMAIILLILSVFRLILNSWGFIGFSKDLEDIQEKNKK